MTKLKYRFFYHYRRQDGKMSVHHRGVCYPTENVECRVPTETHRRKIQPRLVIRGYASDILLQDGKIIII